MRMGQGVRSCLGYGGITYVLHNFLVLDYDLFTIRCIGVVMLN